MGGEFCYGQTWQKVELKDLTSDDVFVIVDVTNSVAISNAATGKSQNASSVKVSLNDTKTSLVGVVSDNLKWKISSNDGKYVFSSNASSGNKLYGAGATDVGLRVGTPNTYKEFVSFESSSYKGLKVNSYKRYVCYNGSKDWRCYASPTNTKEIAFYKYVNDTRKATNVTFGAGVDGEPFNVTEGEESSFSGKTATEKDGVAGTIKYSSNNTAVVSVDALTGVVKFNKTKTFGTATITALFTPADVTKYKESSASYTINYNEKQRITTTIVFSADAGSFDGLGTAYSDTEKEKNYQFVSASKEKYDFKVKHCIKSNNDNSFKGYLQMRPKRSNQECGIVTSPSFTAFPNGYKVTVYYSTGTVKNPGNLTISSKQLPAVKSETVLIANTADGKDFVTTISLPLSKATFIMTANENAKYVSRIELTPLVETVTLDETANNDDVVKNNAGKTVNVTLKRTISDKYLNPFCVPFDMTADQITAVFGEGSVVSAFTSVTGKVMNFEKVATITAGQPYVVQATKASTEISLDNVEMKSEPGSNVVKESSELSMSFNGIVSPYTFKKNDGTELFLDKNGNLRYPSTLPSQMKGMRAYFEVLGGTSNEAKVNIGGGLSSIDKLMNGEAMTGKVYNLNGQYVGNTLDGLAKGLYIMNGKKYVVK